MVKRHTRKRQWKYFGPWRKTFFKWFFRILMPVGLLGLGTAVFLGVRGRLYADPYFQIERISVYPPHLLSEADERFLTSELSRKNLLRVNLRAISRALEKNPGIQRAEAVRSFPDQLKVFLTPRTPFVQVQNTARGPYYFVSEDRIIVSVSKTPGRGFRTVEDFWMGKKSYAPGMVYPNPYFAEWKRFFDWFDRDPILKSEAPSRFSVDHLGNMTAVLKDGIELRFGRFPGFQGDAAAILRPLLRSEERKKILYFDFRYQDVIVKKKPQ